MARLLALSVHHLPAKQFDKLMRQRSDERCDDEVLIADAASHDRTGDGRHVKGELAAAEAVKDRRVLFELLVNVAGRSLHFFRLGGLEGRMDC